MHNGYPVYSSGAYYLYAGGTGWYLSDDTQDAPLAQYWYGPPYDIGPAGVYDPAAGATGTATVLQAITESSSSTTSDVSSSSSTQVLSTSSFSGDILTISGDLSPNSTGICWENGTYGLGSLPAYEREDGGYWIWHEGLPVGNYYISQTKGDLTEEYWLNQNSLNSLGTYTSQNGASGTATVA